MHDHTPPFYPTHYAMVDTSKSTVNAKRIIFRLLALALAGEINIVVAVYKFSSVFVFEIACLSTSTGFSWDHHRISKKKFGT